MKDYGLFIVGNNPFGIPRKCHGRKYDPLIGDEYLNVRYGRFIFGLGNCGADVS